LNVDSRFTLNCVGPGGQTSKSVDIQVKVASTGGGGTTQLGLLVLLLLAGAARRHTRSPGKIYIGVAE
jgi:MYXO-CTERM domain-containing protein